MINRKLHLHSERPIAISECIGAFFLFLLILFLLKMPYLVLPIIYFDDGETLYHVFELMQGGVPYRDSYTHHFTGYVLPIFLVAKFIGYSIDLIRHAFVFNQALMALGTYLCAREFFSRKLALIAGLLALTAREPFVYSFFPLYEVSSCAIFMLWLALRAVRFPTRRLTLLVCFFLGGIAFSLDQRGLLLISIPLSAIALSPEILISEKLKRFVSGLCVYCIVPLTALMALMTLGVADQFIDQTLIYPQKFRIASISVWDQLVLAIWIHRHLIIETPLLFALGVTGLAGLLVTASSAQGSLRQQSHVILLSALPLFAIAFLGGRDFNYYTIPWLPWISFVAVFSINLFRRSERLFQVIQLILVTPVILCVCSLPALIHHLPVLRARNEAQRIATLFREQAKPEDRIFVFGYRPDIYATIPTVSPLPFVNVIYFHPDALITGREARLAHVDQKREAEFREKFSFRPPEFVVMVDLQLGDADYSPAREFVKGKLESSYEVIGEFSGPEVRGRVSVLTVHRLKN